MKHHWLDWNEMSEDYILQFPEEFGGRFIPNANHKIIHTETRVLNSGTRNYYYIEFEEPLRNKVYPNGKLIAQSFAQWVFPNLHFPRWHRAGGSMVIVRHPGTLRWLNENLSTPLLGILTSKLLYVTTDDPEDFVLIKLRCEEYVEQYTI